MFITGLLIMTQSYKQCRLLHVVNDKLWCFHTIEYYSAKKDTTDGRICLSALCYQRSKTQKAVYSIDKTFGKRQTYRKIKYHGLLVVGVVEGLTTKEDKEAFGVEEMCMLITAVIRLWVCQNSDINTGKCDCMQSVPICKLHLNKKMQSIKGV